MQALALFYDFRELTPIGADGDEMVRRLARRLIDGVWFDYRVVPALWNSLWVASLSTLVVVDPAGKVTYRATDPSADQITTALRDAGAA